MVIYYVAYPWYVRKLQALARWIDRYAERHKQLTPYKPWPLSNGDPYWGESDRQAHRLGFWR